MTRMRVNVIIKLHVVLRNFLKKLRPLPTKNVNAGVTDFVGSGLIYPTIICFFR